MSRALIMLGNVASWLDIPNRDMNAVFSAASTAQEPAIPDGILLGPGVWVQAQVAPRQKTDVLPIGQRNKGAQFRQLCS